MARSYLWARHYGSATPFASGRCAVIGTRFEIPAGGATFERGIIGFQVVADDGGSGPVYRGDSNIVCGAVLWSSSGSPDLSPDTSPGSDWKWAGHFTLKVIPLFGYNTDDIVIGWWSETPQIEFTTRQTFAEGASVGLTWCTSVLSTFSDGSRPWQLGVWSAALWSYQA